MQTNNDRQNISLEEALAFIKYINKERPFTKEEIVIPTRDYSDQSLYKQSVPTPKDRSKKIQREEVSEDIAKKLNKNRAIKRIIQSAYQILQNFGTYEEEIGTDSSDKSSEIQLSIYLKQYNRVLENIYKIEKERINRQAIKTEHQEEVLQNIYEYTVVEDFREILPVAILKDKISKTNIEIMIESLSKSLVVLKPNELRIYDSVETSGNYKTVKLHEIENVDYHTQPHILMVLSIQKDKERFNIYMQFQSQKNQEKWDRALYCCYIGRKMKTKEKFFLIEYPEEDVKKKQKQETTDQAAFNYDIEDSKRTPINKIINEKHTPLLSQKSRQDDDMKSQSNTQGRRKPLSSVSKDQPESQVLKESISGVGSNKAHPDSKSNKFTNNDAETNRFIEAEKKRKAQEAEVTNRIKTDYIKITKEPSIDPNNSPHHNNYSNRDKSKTNIFSNLNNQTDNRDQFDREDELNILQEEEPEMPEDIVEIHNLERKHVKGIVLEKEKFFFNKAKKVYLKEGNKTQIGEENLGGKKKSDIQGEYESMKLRELWYLDFDSKTGEQINPKVIKVIDIKSYVIKDQKILNIVHEKQIAFTGDIQMLNEIYKWIDLVQSTWKDRISTLAPPEGNKLH